MAKGKGKRKQVEEEEEEVEEVVEEEAVPEIVLRRRRNMARNAAVMASLNITQVWYMLVLSVLLLSTAQHNALYCI